MAGLCRHQELPRRRHGPPAPVRGRRGARLEESPQLVGRRGGGGGDHRAAGGQGHDVQRDAAPGPRLARFEGRRGASGPALPEAEALGNPLGCLASDAGAEIPCGFLALGWCERPPSFRNGPTRCRRDASAASCPLLRPQGNWRAKESRGAKPRGSTRIGLHVFFCQGACFLTTKCRSVSMVCTPYSQYAY